MKMFLYLILLVILQITLPTQSSKPDVLDVATNMYSKWQLSSSTVESWFDIASNSDGKYSYASSANGIYRSVDFGMSYSLITSAYWSAVSTNAIGDRVVAHHSFNGLMVSNDYGVTFSATGVISSSNSGLDIVQSSSGQYIYVTYVNSSLSGGNFHRSSDYGSTFSLSPAAMSGPLSCSSDGQYVFRGRADGKVDVSSDFGSSFTSYAATSDSIDGIACSSACQKCAIISDIHVYLTSDYGVTWSQSNITTAPKFAYGRPFSNIVSSSTGQYLAVSVYNKHIHQSSDYGATWYQSTSFVAPWYSLASDSSGLNLFAGVFTTDKGNLFYLHTNTVGGVSPSAAPTLAAAPSVSAVPGKWNYSTNLPYAQYSALTFSSSGQYVAVSATTSSFQESYPIYGIYSSSDFGSSFTSSTLNGITVDNTYGTGATQWTDVKISNTGQFVLASELNNGVFLSTDYGASFDPLYAPTNSYTYKIATSDDFIYMFAIVVDLSSSLEYWYRSDDAGDTWTSQIGSSTPVTYDVTATTISCSTTGQYVVIAQSATSLLFVSSTYGSFYLPPSSQSASYTWSDVTMSSTGQRVYVVAADTNSHVLVSSDFGDTFTSSLSTTFSSATSITCDYAGKLLTLTTSTGSVYHSVDSGHSWVLQLSEAEVQFSAVATNYVSSHLAVVGSPGFGYFLTNTTIASLAPTRRPSAAPSRQPSLAPTRIPSRLPTLHPSVLPTRAPSLSPTALPTIEPTVAPFVTASPTLTPSSQPTTTHPSLRPSLEPTLVPSRLPTSTPSPTTITPTQSPTSSVPTRDPASSVPPTEEPTHRPSRQPTNFPSFEQAVVPDDKSTVKHSDTTGIIIGVVIAVLAIIAVCLFFVYRIIEKRRHHSRVYAAPQALPPPQYGDDDYMAPVIDNNLDVEAQFEEEVQRRMNQMDRLEQHIQQHESNLLLTQQQQGDGVVQDVEEEEEEEEALEEDPEEEINQAFPLAHIENNPDGSVREAVVVMAQWAPVTGEAGDHHQGQLHQHLPTDTGDLVEVFEGEEMQDGVVFVPDNFVVMVDASPV